MLLNIKLHLFSGGGVRTFMGNLITVCCVTVTLFSSLPYQLWVIATNRCLFEARPSCWFHTLHCICSIVLPEVFSVPLSFWSEPAALKSRNLPDPVCAQQWARRCVSSVTSGRQVLPPSPLTADMNSVHGQSLLSHEPLNSSFQSWWRRSQDKIHSCICSALWNPIMQ